MGRKPDNNGEPRWSVLGIVVFSIGCMWALFVWRQGWQYPMPRHFLRDAHLSALREAIWVATSYPLVAIYRHRGYAMRAFVITAFAILMAQWYLGVVAGQFRLGAEWYNFGPPSVGLLTGLIVAVSRRRQRLPNYPACVKCGYNLTGNISGRCPECGTPIAGVPRRAG